jgi:hypothetical protein
MDPIAEFNQLTDLVKTQPHIYKMALKAKLRHDTLLQIAKEPALFGWVARTKGAIFDDPDRALIKLKSSADDAVLIHFAGIGVYKIVTPGQYYTLVGDLRDGCGFDETSGAKLQLYQIVLTNKSQKLVFACTDAAQFEKLRKYAGDCFHADTLLSDNQITVNITLSTETELVDSYERFYTYVHEHDQMAGLSIHPITCFHGITDRWRRYAQTDILKAEDEDQLIKLLRSGGIKITINGDHNNVVVAGTQTVKMSNPQKERATTWIKANPPNEREVTTSYHLRYKTANPGGLNAQPFAECVKKEGWTCYPSNKKRYWVH